MMAPWYRMCQDMAQRAAARRARRWPPVITLTEHTREGRSKVEHSQSVASAAGSLRPP